MDPPILQVVDDEYAQENGHPPCAAETVCIDFDGTICPWGPLMEDRPPFCGVKDALRALAMQDYRIVILTSRLSPTWWAAEAEVRGVKPLAFGAEQIQFVTDYMARWGLPYDALTCEKVPALAYLDDKAWRVAPADHAFGLAVGEFIGRTT